MLICMQKINFITQFFVKILQRNSKLVFWVIWASLATHNWNGTRNLKKPLTFICRQTIKFILYVFLEILQRYCKLIVTNPRWYYQLVENFRLFSGKKVTSLLPRAFLKILQKYANFLFWILWPCLVAHTQNDSFNQLVEDLDVYLHAKNKRHHSLLSWDITF